MACSIKSKAGGKEEFLGFCGEKGELGIYRLGPDGYVNCSRDTMPMADWMVM